MSLGIPLTQQPLVVGKGGKVIRERLEDIGLNLEEHCSRPPKQSSGRCKRQASFHGEAA